MTDPNVDVVERELEAGRLSFTLGEAAARTGLAIDHLRNALDQLLRRYYCRLRVTDKAEVIYDFGPKLRRTGGLTFAEVASKAGRLFGRAFRFLFRIWLTGMLVCYFTVFAVAAIAAAVAAVAGAGGSGSSSDSRRGRHGGGGDLVNVLFQTLWSVFRWQTHTSRTYRRQDPHGYPYRRFEPQPSPVREDKKSFVASVHDFVFGPEPVDPDPLANAREVAAFVRKERGVVVASDLVALAGWTAEEADRFLVECSLRFEGELGASEGGVIFARFDKLLRDAGKAGKAGKAGDDADSIEHYWNEYEPEYELTGNDAGRNTAVVALNVANLAFSGGMVSGVIPAVAGGLFGGAVASLLAAGPISLVFGWVPFLFSLLYFVIPAIRAPFVNRANQRRLVNNLRKRVIRVLFDTAGEPLTAEEVVERMNRHSPEEKVTAQTVEPMLKRLQQELRGSDLRDDDMIPRYSFPAIALESREAHTMRAQNVVDRDLGQVVIDSGAGAEIE